MKGEDPDEGHKLDDDVAKKNLKQADLETIR